MYIEHYNAIKLLNDSFPGIDETDWFNRQYQRTQELKPTKKVACYVEFGNRTPWRTEGNKVQFAEAIISFHYAVFNLPDSPEKVLQLESDHFKYIHGKSLFDANGFQLSTGLVRVNTELITDFDQIKVVIADYQATIVDVSAVDQLTEVNPWNLIVST